MSSEQAVAHASVAEVFELDREQMNDTASRSLLALGRWLDADSTPPEAVQAYLTLQMIVEQQHTTIGELFEAAHKVTKP